MPFLSKNEAFKGYVHAVIVDIYTDRITVTAVRKENNAANIVASTVEPVENAGVYDGMISAEKIVFNMEKAIMALPHDARAAATPVIVVLGPGAGSYAYVTVKGKREARERKITAEELETMIAAIHTEKGNTRVSSNYPEHFSIDGFSIPDPVGVNGAEVVAGVVRIACDAAFEQECATRITALGLRFAGMTDMRYAAMHADRFFQKSMNAFLVFVFENETHAVLMREKAVHAIGTAHAGYGILNADIARAFAVGYEEAKAIVRAYRKGELDAGTKVFIETIFAAAAQKIVDAAQETAARMVSDTIIPGNVHVVCADRIPEVTARFSAGDWLTRLPIERNAVVQVVSEENASTFSSPFDRMTIDFLTGHH